MIHSAFVRRRFVFTALAILLSAGCGSDSTTAPPGPTALQGGVFKGPIVGATLYVYLIHADGSQGGQVGGPWTTDANGNWAGQVDYGIGGPFLMVSTGGTYVDEATGGTVSLAGVQLYGIMQGTQAQVSPLTHATFLGMQALVAGGMTLDDAITQAFANAQTAFGYNIATTAPSDAAGATANAKNYAGLLGGLATLLNANPALSAFVNTPIADLVAALSADLANGKLDGLNAMGTTINVPTDSTHTTTLPWPALSPADLSAWMNAANAYVATVTSLSGITYNTNLVWNPSDPGGAASGHVTFSGPGTGYLLSTDFTPTTALYTSGNYVWVDVPNSVTITVVPVAGSFTLVQTVQVSVANGAYLWTAHGASGLVGVTRSGGVTTFSTLATQELLGALTVLILDGSLDEVALP